MDTFKTAVILAGGKSSRMGFDKQFLKIDNKRILDELIQKLKKEFEEIIVVTNKSYNYKEYNVKIVSDEIKEKGPLSGIHAGLKASNSKYVYFIACDMPNINLDYIRFMKEKIKDLNIDACITKKQENLEPFNAFYSINLVEYIEKFIYQKPRSLYYLLNSINTFYIEEKIAREYSVDWSMFFNLNTLKDISMYVKEKI
jgi:molybdopterin-guanine dinucleotide biosynthesis protein A